MEMEGVVEDFESEYDSSPRFNPFNNELVLTNFFKYFKIKDLKNFRLVSRLWRDLASPYLQERSITKLDENIHLEGINMTRFFEEFHNVPPSELFFQNFKLTLWNIDEKNPKIPEFWMTFGPAVRSLEISWARFVSIKTVRNILFNWTPNMKTLILRDCSFYEYENEAELKVLRVATKIQIPFDTSTEIKINPNLTSLQFYGGEPHTNPPITWDETFLTYPNLKQLLMYNINPVETLGIIEAIKRIRTKNPHALNIEKLNIFNGDYAASEIPSHILTAFIDLKLPLTQLELDIGAMCNEYLLSKLLKQHSRTLRKLTIYRGPLGTPMIYFPFDVTFPNLKRLELTETVSDTFTFIQFMPNLTSLSVCEPPDVEPPFLPTDMLFKTGYDFPNANLPLNLTSLRIDYDCSYGDVRKLVHWFPNVKSVRMYLDNESFRTVCGEWRDLEELEILGDKVNDEGITGIKLKNENGRDFMIKNPLCITRLKQLRSFVMKNYGLSTSITDLSVFEGLTKMRSLTTLEVCSRHITEVAWKLLHNQSNLLTLIPSDGRWQSTCEVFRKGCTCVC